MSTIPGIGSVEPKPALDNLDLLAAPVAEALEAVVADNPELADQALAVAIDPDLADTEAMTEAFGMDLSLSANCILVAGKRAGEERVAACLVRAHTFADVNHVVKKTLNVRKASFWPQEKAVEASGMEYGGITPGRVALRMAAADRHQVHGRLGLHRLRPAQLQALYYR